MLERRNRKKSIIPEEDSKKAFLEESSAGKRKHMTANQEGKIKLIWDFRGPDAGRIAEHHEIHLKEYINRYNLKLKITGIENLNKNHTLAYMVIYESELQSIKDALRPHRGQVYEEKN